MFVHGPGVGCPPGSWVRAQTLSLATFSDGGICRRNLVGAPISPSRLTSAYRGLRPERGVLSLHSRLPEKPWEGFAGTQPPLSVLSLLAGMSCLDRDVTLRHAVAGPRRSWGVRRHLNVAQGAAGLGGGAKGTTSSCSHSGLYLTRPQAGLGWTGVQQESAWRAVASWVVGAIPCTELCRETDRLLGSLGNQTSDSDIVSVTDMLGSVDNLESDPKFFVCRAPSRQCGRLAVSGSIVYGLLRVGKGSGDPGLTTPSYGW